MENIIILVISSFIIRYATCWQFIEKVQMEVIDVHLPYQL